MLRIIQIRKKFKKGEILDVVKEERVDLPGGSYRMLLEIKEPHTSASYEFKTRIMNDDSQYVQVKHVSTITREIREYDYVSPGYLDQNAEMFYPEIIVPRINLKISFSITLEDGSVLNCQLNEVSSYPEDWYKELLYEVYDNFSVNKDDILAIADESINTNEPYRANFKLTFFCKTGPIRLQLQGNARKARPVHQQSIEDDFYIVTYAWNSYSEYSPSYIKLDKLGTFDSYDCRDSYVGMQLKLIAFSGTAEDDEDEYEISYTFLDPATGKQYKFVLED